MFYEDMAGSIVPKLDEFYCLHDAVLYSNVSLVQKLLKESQREVHTLKDGRTPLHVACMTGNVEIGSMLLQRGAKAEVADNCGNYPLHTAILYRNYPIMRLILQNSEEVNFVNTAGKTPLYYLLTFGDAAEAVHLIKKGADINTVAATGDTLLHIMCKQNNENIVEYCLTIESVESNSLNDLGQTPLHVVGINNTGESHFKVAKMLKEKGVNFQIKDKYGRTARDLIQLHQVSPQVRKFFEFNTEEKTP